MMRSAFTSMKALETVSKTLPRFSEQSRERLAGLLNDLHFQGRLPAGAAQQIAAQEGRSIDQLMIDLLPLAQGFSRPPVSNYRVGRSCKAHPAISIWAPILKCRRPWCLVSTLNNRPRAMPIWEATAGSRH